MHRRHLIAIALLISLSGCVGGRGISAGKGGTPITAPAERTAFLDRFKGAYYDLRGHSFVSADCDVHNSFLDEIDTALTAGGASSRTALEQLRATTMTLHLATDQRPTLTSRGEAAIRTGDQEADSMIRHMVSWSSSMLTYGLNVWRNFATGSLTAPPEPLRSAYKVYGDSTGYRIEAIGKIEMILDGALRVNTLTTDLSDGLTIAKTSFRETPGGLVLETLDLTLPNVKAVWRMTFQYAEVDGVLLPSKVDASVDGDLPQLDGTTRPQNLRFTFLMSGYRVAKG